MFLFYTLHLIYIYMQKPRFPLEKKNHEAHNKGLLPRKKGCAFLWDDASPQQLVEGLDPENDVVISRIKTKDIYRKKPFGCFSKFRAPAMEFVRMFETQEPAGAIDVLYIFMCIYIICYNIHTSARPKHIRHLTSSSSPSSSPSSSWSWSWAQIWLNMKHVWERQPNHWLRCDMIYDIWYTVYTYILTNIPQ